MKMECKTGRLVVKQAAEEEAGVNNGVVGKECDHETRKMASCKLDGIGIDRLGE